MFATICRYRQIYFLYMVFCITGTQLRNVLEPLTSLSYFIQPFSNNQAPLTCNCRQEVFPFSCHQRRVQKTITQRSVLTRKYWVITFHDRMFFRNARILKIAGRWIFAEMLDERLGCWTNSCQQLTKCAMSVKQRFVVAKHQRRTHVLTRSPKIHPIRFFNRPIWFPI